MLECRRVQNLMLGCSKAIKKRQVIERSEYTIYYGLYFIIRKHADQLT